MVAMDSHCILSIVEGGLHHYQGPHGGGGGGGGGRRPGTGISECTETHSPIHMQLQDSDLWKEFHRKTNEMIVTKSGRYVCFVSGNTKFVVRNSFNIHLSGDKNTNKLI
jgi:hypothetical protein